MASSSIVQNPPFLLADRRFALSCPDDVFSQLEKEEAKKFLLETIEANDMLHFYLALVEQFNFEKNGDLTLRMKEHNDAKVQQLKARIKDAEENLGESEVREAHLAEADHYSKTLDKDNAVSAYRITLEKTMGLGEKLDIVFTIIRLGFFWKDNALILSNIEKAKEMIASGGDWDRRNRLRVYEGLYLMTSRKWEQAVDLFLDTLATYTCTELFDYKQFIFYVVLISLVTLKRPDLKKRVIDSPDVLSVIEDIPHLGSLLNSFYGAEYKVFFHSLAAITETMKKDRYLSFSTGYFCREMRIRAYCQLLESYRSLQISSLAEAFGVTTEFIDSDLSRFINTGRVHCKIDAVRGIIETSRPDSKNYQFQATVKAGDAVMHRVQKLSRVII